MPYTTEDCIDAVQEAADRLGHEPTKKEYASLDISPSVSAVSRICDGWLRAKELAGVGGDLRGGSRTESDTDYFSEVDAETAYWVGFLMGDGCVYESDLGLRVELCLQEQDRHHVEKFRDALNGRQKIHTKENGGAHYKVQNEDLASDLIDLGVTPSKTTDGTVPDLDEEYRPHFVRGLFDADGTVYETPREGKPRTNITGVNISRLAAVERWLPFQATIHTGEAITPRLYIPAGSFESFRAWLYPDEASTTPALERKRDLILDL